MNNNRSNRNMSSGVSGLIIAGVGFILAWNFFNPVSDYHPSVFNLLIFLGPASLIAGCVISLRGFVWGQEGVEPIYRKVVWFCFTAFRRIPMVLYPFDHTGQGNGRFRNAGNNPFYCCRYSGRCSSIV